MVKLFLKSFRRRCLLKKRQHPKTFLVFYQALVFKHSLRLLSCHPICGYRTEDDTVAHDDCTGKCFVY
ncbi:hypothetical protein F1645_04950 [Novacetimonas hansenii]